jgi:hypothetical protein
MCYPHLITVPRACDAVLCCGDVIVARRILRRGRRAECRGDYKIEMSHFVGHFDSAGPKGLEPSTSCVTGHVTSPTLLHYISDSAFVLTVLLTLFSQSH